MSEEAIRLPALPTSQMNVDVWDSEVRGLHGANAAYYTADQLQEYARAAVLAERERCAKLCDSLGSARDNSSNAYRREITASQVAAAIRKGA